MEDTEKRAVFVTQIEKGWRKMKGEVRLGRESVTFFSGKQDWLVCFLYRDIEDVEFRDKKRLEVTLSNQETYTLRSSHAELIFSTLSKFMRQTFNEMYFLHVSNGVASFYGLFRVFRVPIRESILLFADCVFRFESEGGMRSEKGVLYLTEGFVCVKSLGLRATIPKCNVRCAEFHTSEIVFVLVCGTRYSAVLKKETVEKIRLDFELRDTGRGPSVVLAKAEHFVCRTWKIGVSRDRGDFWYLHSGAKYLSEKEGPYGELKQRHGEVDLRTRHEIAKDVERSHLEDRAVIGGATKERIRRILLCYAVRNPSVGYAQSMNIIVSFLLMHADEERSFWILVSICEQIFPFHYGPNLVGALVEQKTLEELVQKKLPGIHRRFKKIGFVMSAVTFGWITALFTVSFPVDVARRVFDCVFLCGRDAVFFVCLAVLRETMDGLCSCRSEEEVFFVIRKYISGFSNAKKYEAINRLFSRALRYFRETDPEEIEDIRAWSRRRVVVEVERGEKAREVLKGFYRACSVFEVGTEDRIQRNMFCKIAEELFPFPKQNLFYGRAYDRLSDDRGVCYGDLKAFYQEMSQSDVLCFLRYLFGLHEDSARSMSIACLFEFAETFLWMFSGAEKEAVLLRQCSDLFHELEQQSGGKPVSFALFAEGVEQKGEMVVFFEGFLRRFDPV
ncbi:MAG: uncharacterized protein A8A55_1634 [Amphiamblys sp. WSBS2006]|nr:MAG: uncharacterized protein A8A55_1634 [Amphiamblys sp. WSBS2006]